MIERQNFLLPKPLEHTDIVHVSAVPISSTFYFVCGIYMHHLHSRLNPGQMELRTVPQLASQYF